MQRALVAFRKNGSVLPEGPQVAAAPAAPAATPPPAPAKPNVEVIAERKRVDVVRDNSAAAGDESATSEKFIYNIKVQNRAFTDVPPLDVQYVVFLERQKIGEKKDKDTIERVVGTAKTEVLNRKTMSQTVTTSELELWKRVLVGNFYYANGGRRKVEDNVAGIWVKVLHEGQVVAEYANPSTVTKRGWEKK
jgi:hypothetical protein